MTIHLVREGVRPLWFSRTLSLGGPSLFDLAAVSRVLKVTQPHTRDPRRRMLLRDRWINIGLHRMFAEGGLLVSAQ